MPVDKITGKYRPYTEEEMKALRPDWYPAPPVKSPLYPALPQVFQPKGSAPVAPPIFPPNFGQPKQFPGFPPQSAQAPLPAPTQPQFQPTQMPAPTPAMPVDALSPHDVYKPKPSPMSEALARAAAPKPPQMGGRFGGVQKPNMQELQQAGEGVSPNSFGEAWQKVRQFGGRIDQTVQAGMGQQYFDKIVWGKDLPKMTEQYAQYVSTERERGREPVSSRDYFDSIDTNYTTGKQVLGDSDYMRMNIEAGYTEDKLSPGLKGISDTVGGVLGQGAVLGPAGKVGSMAAQKVMQSPLLKNAPAWLQKTVGSIVGAGTTGAAYQAPQELMQEIAYPEQQTLLQHAGDVGKTSAYWAAYGAMSGPAEKIMQKVGNRIPQSVQQSINKFPATKEIGKSVAEGGISGFGVGVGLFGLEVLKTGDAKNAWETMSGEAKNEMLENFAQSFLHAFARRGPGKITFERDVLDELYDNVYNDLSSDMQSEFDNAIQHARQQGYDDQTTKSVIMDYYSQSKDGEIALHKASQSLFAKKFENAVLQQTASATAEATTNAPTAPVRSEKEQKKLERLQSEHGSASSAMENFMTEMEQKYGADNFTGWSIKDNVKYKWLELNEMGALAKLRDYENKFPQTEEASAPEQQPQAPTGPSAQDDLMSQSAAQERGRAKQMIEALNGVPGQEAAARRVVDPANVLEGFSAAPQPAAPEQPTTRPAPVTGSVQGPTQPFSQGETVRHDGKLYQVESDLQGKKRTLVAPDGSRTHVPPQNVRKFEGLAVGDEVTVQGREGVFTVNNTRDGKTIRLKAPNGSIVDLPANKIQPHFSAPVTAATKEVEAPVTEQTQPGGVLDTFRKIRDLGTPEQAEAPVQTATATATIEHSQGDETAGLKTINLNGMKFSEVPLKMLQDIKAHLERVQIEIMNRPGRGDTNLFKTGEVNYAEQGRQFDLQNTIQDLKLVSDRIAELEGQQQQDAPVDERQTDAIGGTAIDLEVNEDPVDTTGDPATVWRKMGEKLAMSGALSAQFKVKHLQAMKAFAEQHGFEWRPRHQELLEKFSAEADANKQAKQGEKDKAQEADTKKAEERQKEEESIRKMRQLYLEDAKKFDTYDSFRQLYSGTPIPQKYRGSQSMDSYLRDVYAEAHGEKPLAERNPLHGRIGETVTFEGPNGNTLTGTIRSIIDEQYVGVDVTIPDYKGTIPFRVHADEISFAEKQGEKPAEQKPAEQTPVDKKTMLENLAVGDIVTLTGKGDQRFTITELKARGFISLRAEAGGSIPDVHRQAVSAVVGKAEEAQAEQKSADENLTPADKSWVSQAGQKNGAGGIILGVLPNWHSDPTSLVEPLNQYVWKGQPFETTDGDEQRIEVSWITGHGKEFHGNAVHLWGMAWRKADGSMGIRMRDGYYDGVSELDGNTVTVWHKTKDWRFSFNLDEAVQLYQGQDRGHKIHEFLKKISGLPDKRMEEAHTAVRIVDKFVETQSGEGAAKSHAAEVLQRQFYAVSPNPDEIEAVRQAQPPNILVSYGTWGEYAGRTKDSIRDLIEKLKAYKVGDRITYVENSEKVQPEFRGPKNGTVDRIIENVGYMVKLDKTISSPGSTAEVLVRFDDPSIQYEPTVIADNGAFSNFNKGRDAQLYEVMAHFKDDLALEPEEAWMEMQRLLNGDDTMTHFPATSEAGLEEILKDAKVDPEAHDALTDIYNRAKDGERINAQEEAEAIFGYEEGDTTEDHYDLVRNVAKAARQDNKQSRWPDFLHFMEWLGYNSPVFDYVMAPDILTKGKKFTEIVKARQESNLGKGSEKHDFDAEYIQELANWTYRVLKEGGYNTIPVFQFFSDHKYMDELIAEGADYIAIATNSDWSKNMDGKTKADRAAYVRDIVQKYKGSGVKFHLLGTNDPELINMIGPGLYSADGTTWQFSMRDKPQGERADAGANDIKDREAEVEARKREAEEVSVGYLTSWAGQSVSMKNHLNRMVWQDSPFEATHGDEERRPANWYQEFGEDGKVRGYVWRKADGTTGLVAADINTKHPSADNKDRVPGHTEKRDLKRWASVQIGEVAKAKVIELLNQGKREEALAAYKEAVRDSGGTLPDSGQYGYTHFKDMIGGYLNRDGKGVKISFYDVTPDLKMTYAEALDTFEIETMPKWWDSIKVTDDIETLKDWVVTRAPNHVNDKEKITQLLRKGKREEALKAYKDGVGTSGQTLPEPYRTPGNMMNDPKGIHIKFSNGIPAINMTFNAALDRFEKLMNQHGAGVTGKTEEATPAEPVNGSITLWVPDGGRETFTDVTGLLKRLRELSEQQLRGIISDYAITGGSKLKPETLPTFIADAIVRDQFQIPKKGMKEIFDRSMKKIKDTVSDKQFARIERMVKKFMDGTVDFRINQVLYQPIQDDDGFAAINYTDLKTDQTYSIVLDTKGDVLEKFTGYSMKRDYPKTLAEWTWDNFNRTVLPVGEADWTGWTLHDRTRAKRAEQLRNSIDDAKWQRDKPAMNGNDNDPDFAEDQAPADKADDFDLESNADVPTGAQKLAELSVGTLVTLHTSIYSDQVFQVGATSTNQYGKKEIKLRNMKVTDVKQPDEITENLDYSPKGYVLTKWKPSKPAADMTKREVIGEFVDHFIQKFNLADKLNGNRNDAIDAFKKAASGYAVYSDGLIIVADRGYIEFYKNGNLLGEKITNIRDLLREFVYKEDIGESVVKPEKVKRKYELISFKPETGDWAEEQRAAMEKLINDSIKDGKRAVWLAHQNPQTKEITVTTLSRPPGTTQPIPLQEVIARDGATKHASYDENIDRYPEVYRNDEVYPEGAKQEDEQPPADTPAPEQTAPPERSPRPLSEDPEKVTPEEYAAYVTVARHAIDRLKFHIAQNSLPTTQGGYRKLVGELLGRPPTEDEWNDLLEAAVQEHAAQNIKDVAEIDGVSDFERTQRLIDLGDRLEKVFKNAGRTLEKVERQQFSTPVPLSAIASYALNAQQGEAVKEGSAGTGSLALPVHIMFGANVKAVELSPRRAAILTALGIEVQNENTFDVKMKVDSVIGNPPFRGQNVGGHTVAFAGSPPWKGGWGDLGNRFLSWDLRAIPDGGRLVYIVSPSVIDSKQNAEFREWLHQNHTVRAMVKIHEGGYESRGTSFGAGIIVVDKGKTATKIKENDQVVLKNGEKGTVISGFKDFNMGDDTTLTTASVDVDGVLENPEPHEIESVNGIPYVHSVDPIYGTAESWQGLLDLVKPLGEDGPYGRIEVASNTGGRRNGGNTSSGTSSGGRGGRSGSSGGSSGSRTGSGNSSVGSGGGRNGGTEPGREESASGGNDQSGGGRTSDVVGGNTSGVSGGVSSQSTETGAPNVVERAPRKTKERSEEDAGPDVSGFVEYVPQGGLTGRPHLGTVVETGNLAMIKYPEEIFTDPAYRPHDILLKAEGAEKKLSDVQLETVHLAKYNWNQDFRSLWIADDTGIGKTGEQMAIAADAWHSGNAKRILIITTSDQVASDDFVNGNVEFGLNMPLTFVNSDTHDNFKDEVREKDQKTRIEEEKRYKPLPNTDGVIVMSKYTFATAQHAVSEWLVGSKDGKLTRHNVMVLVDEAHDYANMGANGKPSNRALALAELYDAFKDRGQFIYSTATGAENLDELQYMFGLGLWDDPDAFGDFKTRLKGYEPSRSTRSNTGNQNAMGRALGATRNPFEREIPLAMMEQMIRELKAEGQYIGRSLSMEGVVLEALPIELTPEEIGEYNRAVEFISRIADKAEEHNTAIGRGNIMAGVVGYMRRLRGYYAMKAIIKHMKEEEAAGRLSRFVLSGEFKKGDDDQESNAMLAAAIRAINDQDKAEGAGGRTVYTDIPEAISDKEELLEMLSGNHAEYDFQKPVPEIPSPIKMLFDAFGDDKVLIITGDVKKDERPAITRNFRQGKTKIIYFNRAANTGISLHDTVGQQIGFYHVDYPYNAKDAKQAEGRSNRTGQVTKPVIFYPYIKGSLDTKFVGTLLSRSASMGAMSRGKANKMGDGELDNFEFSGHAAKLAVERVIPMLDDDTRMAMFGNHANRLHDDPELATQQIKQWFGGEIDVKKFVNYIMYLDFHAGGKVIEQYGEAYKQAIQDIESAGGVVEKFRTFNGREIDKAEGDNITVRHIQTILKPAEEAALERRLAEAEDAVAEAERVLAEATEETIDGMREMLRKAKEKLDEAQADFDKRKKEAEDAFKTRDLYRPRQNLRDAERMLELARTDAQKAEAQAEVDQRRNELTEAEKNRVTDEQYEKFSQRLNKAREELRNRTEKHNNMRGHLDNVGNGGAARDATLQQIPAIRRATAALEVRRTRFEGIKVQMESNISATLIEGKIATTGLMVPIRAALRSAAQEHYAPNPPPASSTNVELRGYQMDDGTRAIGVIIPTWAEAAVLGRLNVRFQYSGQTGDMKALMTHIQAGNDVELEGGFTLTWRPRDKVIAIRGMTRGAHVELFRSLQGETQDFGFIAQSSMFIVQNEAGLGRLIQRFPVKGTGEEESAMALAAGTGTTTRRNPRKPKAPPTVSQNVQNIIETKKVITPKTAHTIAEILADGLDTVIYEGRVMRGAEGVYNHLKSKAIAVRAKSADSWRVVGHELGHAFSKMQTRIGNRQELIDLADALYPNGPNLAQAKKPEEGFAEFFRLWVADPDLAYQYAPKTTADFENYIANDPVLEPLFAKIRTLVDNDFADTATGRAFAGVVSSEFREEEEQGPQGPEYQMSAAQRVKFKMIDFTIPAHHLDKALEEASKRPDISLRRLMSIMGDNRAKALLTFTKVPQDYKGFKLKGPILQDLYEKGIQHIIDYMGNGKVDLNSREIREDVTKRKSAKALYKKYRKMGAKDVFDTVVLALRVQERYATGKYQNGSLPLTKEHADEVIAEARANYPDAIKAAKDLTERFSDIVLKMLVDADIITQETADNVKIGSSDYIPFYYVDNKRRPFGAKNSGRTYGQPVKPFKGQAKPTIDAFQAMMMKLMEVHQTIEYKRVMDLLHDVAETGEAKHFMRMVPAQMDMVKISSEQISEQIFGATGIDLSGALQNINEFKFFTQHKGLDPNRRTILNVKNGKAVEIELAKDLFDSVMAMKPVQVQAIGKMFRHLTRIQRLTGLVTLRYIFSTVMVRDAGAVLTQSDHPMQAFRHSINSLGAIFGIGKEGEPLYDTFVNSGAASGAMENMLRNIGKNNFGDEILDLPAAGWGKVKMGAKMAWVYTVKTPSEAMRVLEEGPRIAEFLATWKREVKEMGFDAEAMWKDYVTGGTDALPKPLQRHMERIFVNAAYAAREVTTNFGLHGEKEWIRKYIPTVPFLQGSVQGFYRFARQWKAHKVKTTLTATVSFGLLSLLSYAFMTGLLSLFDADDDEKKRRKQDYLDMDSAMKDKYWWFPIPGMPGAYYSMAKPFEYAIPANIIERILDQQSGEVGARQWHSDVKSLLSTMTNLDVINNMFNVYMDLSANRNSFGGAIVPAGEEKLPKNLQFGPETSLTTRQFATWITDWTDNPKAGPSPREMDYAVRGILGRYGTGLLNVMDAAYSMAHGENFRDAVKSTKPVGGAAHWPVVGQIIYDRSELGGSRLIDKFYRDLGLAINYSQGANDLIEQKNTKLPGWATERGLELLRALPMLDEVQTQMRDMNNLYKSAINDTSKTPTERERYRLQQNYWRELMAGIPYGKTPPVPDPKTLITVAEAEQMMAYVSAEISKRLTGEIKRKDGPTDQWQYYMALKSGREISFPESQQK